MQENTPFTKDELQLQIDGSIVHNQEGFYTYINDYIGSVNEGQEVEIIIGNEVLYKITKMSLSNLYIIENHSTKKRSVVESIELIRFLSKRYKTFVQKVQESEIHT